MQSALPSVFLSYAHRDGVELTLRLRGDLAGAGFDVWLDSRRIQGGASWTVEIEQAIDHASVVVAIMTAGSYVSDVCRAEQLRSLRKGKRVIPVLAQAGVDVPLHLEARNYRDLSTPAAYSAYFGLLLDDLRSDQPPVELRQAFRSTLVTAPPLPRNYVERPAALAALRDAVLVDEPGPSVALTALRGMGGIGKTILAQALCRDEAVQQAYPDGVLWTTVGREPVYPLMTRMQEVRRALGDQPGPDESELQCIDRYRTIIRAKTALLVIDDVWRSEDVEPFLADAPRSRILFTTRDTSIAAATGAQEHEAGLPSVKHSRALLARWAGLANEQLPPESDQVIAECQQLPLALAMVGAMLRGKPPALWGYVLKCLRDADLEAIQARFPGYQHANMLRVIGVSVDTLEPALRERYFALAVLLEDMAVAPAVQQTLWNVDRDQALATAESFVSLSLASRDDKTEGIRLHDLQLDYVRAEYPERSALDLIRGAVRLSAHVIERDASQFASQVIGRLLPFRGRPAIDRFAAHIAAGAPTPWIRPLQPALHPPGTTLLRTVQAHGQEANGVAISPDGRLAVSCSRDETLKVWDVDTGQLLRVMAGHTDSVEGVAVDWHRRRVASVSQDSTVILWDLDTGRSLHTLTGHAGPVGAVATTPDGSCAISASSDGTLKVWDMTSGACLRTLEGHSSAVHGVAVAFDGTRIVSGSNDATVKLWDAASGGLLQTLRGHAREVYAVAICPDGRRVVSASWDRTLKVWDLETEQAIYTLNGHSAEVTAVVVTSDGRSAISSSWDETVKVWELDTGQARRTLAGHSAGLYAVAVSADGHRAVSVADDGTMNVWDLQAPSTLDERLPSMVNELAVMPDGGRAVFASENGSITLWDIVAGQIVRTFGGRSSIRGVALTGDPLGALTASTSGSLDMWDLESGTRLYSLGGGDRQAEDVAVTADGARATSAHSGGTVKVWDLNARRLLHMLEGHTQTAQAVALTPDGRRCVSGSSDETLKVWDVVEGTLIRTLEGHASLVSDVALIPGAERVISASWDHMLKLWDLESGKVLRTLKGHAYWVDGVAVRADGKMAVSASRDKRLIVWDLVTGSAMSTFTCDGPVHCCAFVDERTVITVDDLGRVHLLRLEWGAARMA